MYLLKRFLAHTLRAILFGRKEEKLDLKFFQTRIVCKNRILSKNENNINGRSNGNM